MAEKNIKTVGDTLNYLIEKFNHEASKETMNVLTVDELLKLSKIGRNIAIVSNAAREEAAAKARENHRP